MSFEMFSVVLAEDEIMRQALQEIWEMAHWDSQGPDPEIPPESLLAQIFEIVDGAVADIDKLAEIRKSEES